MMVYEKKTFTTNFIPTFCTDLECIDCFKLKIPAKKTMGTVRASGYFFTSIDAHSQPISRILTMKGGRCFMSSLKLIIICDRL